MHVLYVFVNTDLPSMSPGKAQAHSGHAANAFMYKHIIVPIRDKHELVNGAPYDWCQSTEQGFGTQINLKGTIADMRHVVAEATHQGFLAEEVYDPTYPYFVDDEIYPLIDQSTITAEPVRVTGGWVLCRRELTAIYVFGDKDDQRLKDIVGIYPLHA